MVESGMEEVIRILGMSCGIRGHREMRILSRMVDVLQEHDEMPDGVGFEKTKEVGWVGSLEGKRM